MVSMSQGSLSLSLFSIFRSMVESKDLLGRVIFLHLEGLGDEIYHCLLEGVILKAQFFGGGLPV